VNSAGAKGGEGATKTVDSRQFHIEVAVALPVFGAFTYRVDEPLRAKVVPGLRVLVPFGRRRVTGYVLGAAAGAAEVGEIKPVLEVLDEFPLFPAAMLPFFTWVSEYYKHPLGEVIRHALPSGLSPADHAVVEKTDRTEAVLADGSLTETERKVLRALNEAGFVPEKELSRCIAAAVPTGLLDDLAHRGVIRRSRRMTSERSRPRLVPYVRLRHSVRDKSGLTPARTRIVAMLEAEGELPLQRLKEAAASAPHLVKALADMGYVTVFSKREYRDPFGEPIAPDSAPELSARQLSAVSQLEAAMDRGFETYLLNGVTGSGKTEVYLHLAAEAVRRGHTVLVLVPEIALITQIERCFRARFGERVAILHSGLSAGERFDQWCRLLQGEAAIAIGARSAIFAPLSNLGAIIVDEEHDASYKQENSPRYNARDLAIVRARQCDCVALLGSATPSVQSYYNASRKKFKELNLPERIENRPLPQIHIVDLRESRGFRGTLRFITPRLQQAMADTLQRREQVLLFLNRRGYATFPVCADCGTALRCKHCDITLTLHQQAGAYRCHYCGFSLAATSACGHCGANGVKPLGLGTEKVEAAVRQLFPSARVARMDRDTTSRKGALLSLLKGLRQHAIDILVGTQMVAKGHDYPAITLVGIVCADLSLSFPDFRAGERTFQLLAQVAGRAGRGDQPGRVYLQTYNPEHFSIAAARRQDFKAFYDHEIGFREALNYPPFARLVLLKISGRHKQETAALAGSLGAECRRLKQRSPDRYQRLEILGPIEASLPKVAGRFRWQIMLKATSTHALHAFIGHLMAARPALLRHRRVRVAVDVDPVFMM